MIESITGVITTVDGETRQFHILPETGWHQWGNATEKLGDTVDALEAMTEGVMDYMGTEE